MTEEIKHETMPVEDVEKKPDLISMDGFRKKKMPTKAELLNKTVENENDINQKLSTVQLVLRNFNKRIHDIEERTTSDMMQSVILILSLKELVSKELNISEEKWEEYVSTVTKRLSDERSKEFDEKNGLVTVDRELKDGDFTIISFDGTINGKPFEGGKSDGILVHIGSKTFLEDFENCLIGKKQSDEFVADIKFPENYPVANLANKIAQFKIKILSVKEKKTGENNEQKTQ